MDMVNEAGITREDEIPEEIIKSDASQKEPENVRNWRQNLKNRGQNPWLQLRCLN